MACTGEDATGPSEIIESTAFFPLDDGHTIDYEVDELIFREEGQVVDTLSYQLREEVVDNFKDETGSTVYIIDRSTRNNTMASWIYDRSWQAMITNNRAIRIEDNTRFIKLRLPITENDTWDGNALFDHTAPVDIGGEAMDYYKNWQSVLTQSNFSITLNDVSYDNVYEVTLADHENGIEIRKATELYADGIGLIFRSLRIMDTQCFDNCRDTPWEQKAERGHIYTQTIIN